MGASRCCRDASETDRTLRFIRRTCKCLGRKPLALHWFTMVDRPWMKDAKVALPRREPRNPVESVGKVVDLPGVGGRGTVNGVVREWVTRDEQTSGGKEKDEKRE